MRSIPMAPVAALFWLAAGAASAQPPAAPQAQSPDTIAKVYACAGIVDAAARLACYDAAVGAMKTAEAEGQFRAIDAASVRQIEREAFGFSLPSLPRLGLPGGGRGDGAPEARTDEVPMTIVRIGSIEGRQSFVMDNGQVWVSIDTIRNRLIRPGGAVVIKRAALGSYRMAVGAGGPGLKVKRAE